MKSQRCRNLCKRQRGNLSRNTNKIDTQSPINTNPEKEMKLSASQEDAEQATHVHSVIQHQEPRTQRKTKEHTILTETEMDNQNMVIHSEKKIQRTTKEHTTPAEMGNQI